MKPTPVTPIPLAQQLAAAEAQARAFRERRAELQADLAELRDQRQAEMRAALSTGGDSPALKAIQAKTAEAEALLEQADSLIADGDRLVQALHEQVKAARTDEERATLAAEVARLSAIAESQIAELNAALEAASKAGGLVVVTLAELERLDKVATFRLTAEARHLDPKAAPLREGWKVAEFSYLQPFEWQVQPLVPPAAGLDLYPIVNLRFYLAAREAAAQAASASTA